ncbi:hypothetical protein [Chitinophaga sp. YIM B06452]|uniref:hypothetical protein n=1 Tax=Chitinophaga sp. YIM B06452 TaxID=3082158 RepID=UPI0031FE4AE1
MALPINYFSKEKALLHLNMGRSVALFARVGEFFESKTFDWIKLERISPEACKCTLVRSFPEGDGFTADVVNFRTVNQLEEGFDAVSNPYTEGTLEECITWMSEKFGIRENASFMIPEDLNKIYAEIYKKGELDLTNNARD